LTSYSPGKSSEASSLVECKDYGRPLTKELIKTEIFSDYHPLVEGRLLDRVIIVASKDIAADARAYVDGVRREQQKTDPALKGMRWSLLKDADKLNLAQLTDLEALISQYTTNRTARA
jgi:hypothetical protein